MCESDDALSRSITRSATHQRLRVFADKVAPLYLFVDERIQNITVGASVLDVIDVVVEVAVSIDDL